MNSPSLLVCHRPSKTYLSDSPSTHVVRNWPRSGAWDLSVPQSFFTIPEVKKQEHGHRSFLLPEIYILVRVKTPEAQMRKCQGIPGQLKATLPTPAKVQAKGHKERGFPWRESSRICTPAQLTKAPKCWPAEGAPALCLVWHGSNRPARISTLRVWISRPLSTRVYLQAQIQELRNVSISK